MGKTIKYRITQNIYWSALKVYCTNANSIQPRKWMKA